jgi:hypothetical protein
LQTFVAPVAAGPGATKWFADFSWSYLNTALGKYAIGLAVLGFLWSIIQRRSFGIVLALWTVALFFFANIGVLGLPGANFINNTSVAISLFIPLALLGGYLLGWVALGWANLTPARWQPIYWTGVVLLSSMLAFFSARALLPILNPGTILIRQADLPALEWMDENLLKNETVLINPFLWGYNLYAGNDGGYWISPLAGLNTLPPAVLYNFDFTGENTKRITANVQKANELAANPEALHQFLLETGIRYIFIGARGGVLSPITLLNSPLFKNLYNLDGAYLFEVN